MKRIVTTTTYEAIGSTTKGGTDELTIPIWFLITVVILSFAILKFAIPKPKPTPQKK